MQLDVPYRRVAEVDIARLEALASTLEPLYASTGASVWPVVAERSRFIGETVRPADVAYRKMRPAGYVQLCVVNDEEPMAPWALRIPPSMLSEQQRRALIDDQTRTCASIYGEGTLTMLVFAVLAPGGSIPTHKDMPHDPNKKAFSHHLHVPITAAGDAEFTLRGEKVVFERGGVYEIDNVSPHSVVNRGSAYRVNLMLDYCPQANMALRQQAGSG